VRKQAFTLIELLIVVIIIGIVYTLAINSLNDIKRFQEGKKITLSNLKEQLFSYEFDKEIRIVCFDDCLTCKVIIDREKEISIDPFLDKDIVIYRYDNELAQMVREEIEPYFSSEKEERSCFSFRIYKNGSSEQIYVQKGKRVYWLGDYFKTKVYDSLDDAKKARADLAQKALL